MIPKVFLFLKWNWKKCAQHHLKEAIYGEHTPYFVGICTLIVYIQPLHIFFQQTFKYRYREWYDVLKDVGGEQTLHLAPRWMRPKIFCTIKKGGSYTEALRMGLMCSTQDSDCDGHSVMLLLIWSKHSFFTFHGITPLTPDHEQNFLPWFWKFHHLKRNQFPGKIICAIIKSLIILRWIVSHQFRYPTLYFSLCLVFTALLF